jgi:hypothetical protein
MISAIKVPNSEYAKTIWNYYQKLFNYLSSVKKDEK